MIDASRLDIVAEELSGQRLALDITIASPVTTSAIAVGSATKAGAAALILETGKRRKYGNLDVTPIAIETHDWLGPGARTLIGKLGRQIEPSRRPAYVARLQQDISCALQRANAAMVIRVVAA